MQSEYTARGVVSELGVVFARGVVSGLVESVSAIPPKWFETVSTEGTAIFQTYSGVSGKKSVYLSSSGGGCGVSASGTRFLHMFIEWLDLTLSSFAQDHCPAPGQSTSDQKSDGAEQRALVSHSFLHL